MAFVPLYALVILVFLVLISLRILREYERGVIFLLGRFWKAKGPGLIIVIPVIQQMVRVLLKLSSPPSSDAADALAVAMCHANQTIINGEPVK